MIFLVEISPKWKTGLYNAVLARISMHNNPACYCLNYYDGLLIRLFKRILGRRINDRQEMFCDQGITFKTINIQVSIFRSILKYYYPFAYFWCQKDAKEIHRKLRIDSLHKSDISAHWGLSCGVLCFFLNKLYGNKYTVTYHGSDIHGRPFKNFFYRRYLLKTLAVASSNIFISKGILEYARALGYQLSNYTIIYNGVDKSRFKSSRLVDLSRRPVKLGFIGNLYYVKGADMLPEILRELAKAVPEIKFTLVGDGGLKQSIISSLESIGIDYSYLGKVSPESMPNIYENLDIVVIPSRSEGLSLVAIEALASGCIVIASNVGGLPEVLNEDFLVELDQKFVENFSNKIIETINSRAISQGMPEKFSVETVREIEIEHFNKVMKLSVRNENA